MDSKQGLFLRFDPAVAPVEKKLQHFASGIWLRLATRLTRSFGGPPGHRSTAYDYANSAKRASFWRSLGLRFRYASGAPAARLRPLRASLLTSFANSAKRASFLTSYRREVRNPLGVSDLFSTFWKILGLRYAPPSGSCAAAAPASRFTRSHRALTPSSFFRSYPRMPPH